MLVSTQDPVGQVVGYVCSMAAKAVSKYVSRTSNANSRHDSHVAHRYTVIRDEIQQGISVVSLVGKAAKAASSSSKSGSKPPSKKKAKLIIKGIKVGNPLDMGLKKAGLPTLKEMGQVLKCTVTISKSFKSLAKARDASALLKVIKTMDGCVSKLAALSEKVPTHCFIRTANQFYSFAVRRPRRYGRINGAVRRGQCRVYRLLYCFQRGGEVSAPDPSLHTAYLY